MSNHTDATSEWVLTGKHVLAITVGAFSIIIAVNMTLATQAVATFPGLEVKNSYVASQSFEARRDAQEALGWNVAARIEDGQLAVSFADREGAIVEPDQVAALLGRTTNTSQDQHPAFTFNGVDWTAPVSVGPGMWTLMLKANAEDGTPFEKRISLWVK